MNSPDNDTDTRKARAQRRAAAVLVATFLAGGAAGAGIEHARLGRRPEHFRPGMHLPPMFHELGLNEDQREKIFVVMERRRPEFEAVMSEMAPRMRAIGDSMDADLRPILTEAQQKKLAELRERPPPFGFGPPE